MINPQSEISGLRGICSSNLANGVAGESVVVLIHISFFVNEVKMYHSGLIGSSEFLLDYTP